MSKILKQLYLALAIIICAGVIGVGTNGVAMAASGTAGNKEEICKGIEATGGDCKPGGTEITDLVATIINVFSWIVGVVCVIMVIYGGFRYVTSGGDSTHTASAKNTIIYALVGLVVVALAQVLVKFVLLKVAG